jgi:8-amino-3,8-dideoxy-alpha-D-manno-octulosonate transaminase
MLHRLVYAFRIAPASAAVYCHIRGRKRVNYLYQDGKKQRKGALDMTTMTAQLAVDGGPKTIEKFEGSGPPKIGVDEFIALAEVWGYSAEALSGIRRIVEREKGLPSPHLARYYNPKPSKVAELETCAREIFGSKYALAVNSGTSALITAMVACGIGPGDEVIVPGYTFFATAAAVVSAKAIPVIAEVDDSLTMDPVDVERKITPQTKAIVPVHMVGCCSNMGALMQVARKHNLIVIEDNAQACGGSFKGRLLGSIGHMGCFSISTFKITGAGEAGLVLTDDEWLYTRGQNQHDTGACWRPDRFAREQKPGELFVGQNYRLSELEGAVNLVQMKKTVAQAKRWNTNLRRVIDRLDKFPQTQLRRSNDIQGDVGYTLVLLAGNPEATNKLADALKAEGVNCGGRGTKAYRDWHIYSYWEHIIEQKTATPEKCPFSCPYYKGQLPKYSSDMCPQTSDLLSRAIFINIDQWWTEADCQHVADAINKVCRVLG